VRTPIPLIYNPKLCTILHEIGPQAYTSSLYTHIARINQNQSINTDDKLVVID